MLDARHAGSTEQRLRVLRLDGATQARPAASLVLGSPCSSVDA